MGIIDKTPTKDDFRHFNASVSWLNVRKIIFLWHLLTY